jgi:hypothetical protein
VEAGSVISHTDMCAREGKNLQAGMHFQIAPTHSVLLMSTRRGAPYTDAVEDDGQVLIYEGHDVPRSSVVPDPKAADQPLLTDKGSPTQNGRFYRAAEAARNGERHPERVRVYEKVRPGVWVYNGLFVLVDAWQEESRGRLVCKFRLKAIPQDATVHQAQDPSSLEHTRVIPSSVKRAVWARDQGRCRLCGSGDNLHFDHIIPFSLGGSSLTADNIQLLCARHNLEKHARIE